MLKADRNKIESDKFSLAILQTPEEFSCSIGFDCDKPDLNEFFQRDALAHKEQLLAETYYFQPKEITSKGVVLNRESSHSPINTPATMEPPMKKPIPINFAAAFHLSISGHNIKTANVKSQCVY